MFEISAVTGAGINRLVTALGSLIERIQKESQAA
jgi:hypothetical protein